MEELKPFMPGTNTSWWDACKQTFGYARLESQGRRLNDGRIGRGLLCAMLAAGLLALATTITLGIMTFRKPASKWPEDGYVRYPTPGSLGPKHQARIYYHNATEWSRNNAHDHGEWKIRMDDQALIPATAWDEDRYQQWYHARYPEMRDIIRNRKFLRPSWLGSMDVFVSWDKKFHLAHCVLTLRRYWKAKETGRHVCPRDIDFNHIRHCLNWFDGMVFSDDPDSVPKMGTHMIWQTKVCY